MDGKPVHEIKVAINSTVIVLDDGEYTGAQLKERGNVPAGEALFLKHGHGRDERIDDNTIVKIHPNMVFESSPDGGVS